jgi:hypothetical protein
LTLILTVRQVAALCVFGVTLPESLSRSASGLASGLLPWSGDARSRGGALRCCWARGAPGILCGLSGHASQPLMRAAHTARCLILKLHHL